MLRNETADRIDERDRGLTRAAQLRVAGAMGAAVLTAVVGFLAAGSLPGRASVVGQTSSSGTGLVPAAAPGLAPPQQAPGDGGGSAPIAVSGGS